MDNQKHEMEFEKALISHLRNNKIDKKELTGLSKNLAGAAKNGLKIIDWHIVGQPPAIDGIHFTGHLDASKVAGLNKIVADEFWRELKIFRKAIPFPDIFEVSGIAEIRNQVG